MFVVVVRIVVVRIYIFLLNPKYVNKKINNEAVGRAINISYKIDDILI